MSQIEEHKKLIDFVHDVYVRKNHDYGDSFGRSFKKYGIVAALVRMEDKWNRLENLAGGAKQKVMDESIRDTCLDLANYCLMTVMELDRKKAVEKIREYLRSRRRARTQKITLLLMIWWMGLMKLLKRAPLSS